MISTSRNDQIENAIESNAAIKLAPHIAKDNAYHQDIQFIRAESTAVELPERVDVIVSDLRGALPLYGMHIPSVIDARERFLKEGGTLIPRQDALWVVPIEDQERYQSDLAVWREGPFGINLEAGTQYVTNNIISFNLKPDQMLAKPKSWATLDYRTLTSPHASGQITSTITHSGTAHGLAVWFDAELLEGIGFFTKATRSIPSFVKPAGLLIQAIINRFDGQTTLDEIATGIMNAFPGRFKSFADALGYVGKIAKSYS